MTNNTCPIWGTPASFEPNGDYDDVVSPRAGGKYRIWGSAVSVMGNYDDAVKALLTTWLIDERRQGIECPKVTSYLLDDIKRRRPLSVHARADRLLICIRDQTPAIGRHFDFSIQYNSQANRSWIESESFAQMKAWSESTESALTQKPKNDQVMYLIEYLSKKGFIEKKDYKRGGDNGPYSDKLHVYEYLITPEGYAHLEELEKKAVDSTQAFVAMWFDDSMKAAYEKGIEPAIRKIGYEPLRIDQKEHINRIDDEIIAEIRRSRFLIADFTSDFDFTKDIEKPEKKGARGGVYYEAGFAHGLNIPVIFTCRADVIDKAHFDTRQYNHITWTPDQLDEFREALTNRISATIGDGPLKKAE